MRFQKYPDTFGRGLSQMEAGRIDDSAKNGEKEVFTKMDCVLITNP